MIDPRYPEKAIPRIRELYDQYDGVFKKVRECGSFSELGMLEREGTAVVQELYILTPRLHEALMEASRIRRRDISRAPVNQSGHTPEIASEDVEKPVEKYVAPNQAETVFVEPKPRKRKTAKKKAE